jgi:predicted RNA-binding Zn-ribbon protein involved in translation (DUF1610 family)
MGDDNGDARPLSRIDRVRCLSCGATYIKPAAATTVSANPGCPECGYVGWVIDRTATGNAPNRFFSGRRRRRTG